MKKAGFTLIELLVVITIIVSTGVILLPRLGQFKDNQNLENAAEKLISAIKRTQSNAVSGANCGDQFNPGQKSVDWRLIIMSTSYTTEPNCGGAASLNIPRVSENLPSGVSLYRVNFDNLTREGDPVDLSAAPDGRAGSLASFTNIGSDIDFKDGSGVPVLNYNRMIIVLQVSNRPDRIGIFIEKGGLLYIGAVR